MTPSGPNLMTLLVPAILSLVIAIVFLRKGLRHRVGDTPHCAKCGYDITWLLSSHCPECGQDLPASNLVFGDLRRRPRLIIIAVFGLLLSGTLFVMSGYRVDWYQFRPAGWVMSDLESNNRQQARHAWQELMRRDQAGSLSGARQHQLVELCLRDQATFPPTVVLSEEMEYLASLFLKKHLSPSQEEAFLEHIVQAFIFVRAKIVLGHPLPYELDFDGRGLSDHFWFREDCAGVILDGKLTDLRMPAQSVIGAGGGVGVNEYILLPMDLHAGHHTAIVNTHIQIFQGPFPRTNESTLLRELDVPLKADFEVLPADTIDDVTAIRDPTLAKEIRGCLHPTDLEYWSQCFRCGLALNGQPPDFAYDVYLRVQGKEFALGSIHAWDTSVGKNWLGNESADAPPPFTTCDIILRGSREAARKTLDVFEYWDGELVYKDVPVRSENPVTQPTQPTLGILRRGAE